MSKPFSKAILHPFQKLAQTIGRNQKARNVILGLLALSAVLPSVGCVNKNAAPSMDIPASSPRAQASISMEGQYVNVKEDNRYRATFFDTSKDGRPATVITLEDKGQNIVADYGRNVNVTPKQSTITLQKTGDVIDGLYNTSTYRLGQLYEVHIPFTIANNGNGTVLTAGYPVRTNNSIAADFDPSYGGTATLQNVLKEIRTGVCLYNQKKGLAAHPNGSSRPASVGDHTILDHSNDVGRSTSVRRTGDTNNFEVVVTTVYFNANFPGGKRSKDITYTPVIGAQSVNDWILQESAHLNHTQPALPFNRLPPSMKDEYIACTHILSALEASRLSHPNGYDRGEDPMETGVVTYLDTTNFTQQGASRFSYGGRPSNTEWPILLLDGSRVYEEAREDRVRNAADLEAYVTGRLEQVLKAMGPNAFVKNGAMLNNAASINMNGAASLPQSESSIIHAPQGKGKAGYQSFGVPVFK